MIDFEAGLKLRRGKTIYAIRDNKIVEGKIYKTYLPDTDSPRQLPIIKIIWRVKNGTTNREFSIYRNFPARDVFLTKQEVAEAAIELFDNQIKEHNRVIGLIEEKKAAAKKFAES